MGPAPVMGASFNKSYMFPSEYPTSFNATNEFARSAPHRFLASIKEAAEDVNNQQSNSNINNAAAAAAAAAAATKVGDVEVTSEIFPDMRRLIADAVARLGR